MSKKIKLIFAILLFIAVGLMAKFALAADFGLNEVSSTINLSQADPRVIIARIIQIALTFLGVIALVLIIYAGFLWMTSGGEEEKIEQAKRILKNAIIGIIIILSAWAVTTFILNRLLDAFGAGNNGYTPTTTIIDTGLGAMGACTVETTYPESNQKDVARNSSIMITFKEEIKLDSVCLDNNSIPCTCGEASCNKINPETIRVYESDLGDACSDTCPTPSTNVTDVLVTIASGNKILILTPLSPLGSPDINTWYTVRITKDFKKVDGSSMFQYCGSNELRWGFEVSTNLDLTPPIVNLGGIFPQPDNDEDIQGEVASAQAATGAITVNDCPQIYSSAQVIQITPNDSTVELDYRGAVSKFTVSVPADAPNKAQLFDDRNSLLGVTDWTSEGVATFSGYLSIQTNNPQAGNLWEISIQPEQLADTLTVDTTIYTFAATSQNNNIFVDVANCNEEQQAMAIQAKLSGNPAVDVLRSNRKVILTAKIAGKGGNDIAINTTNPTDLRIDDMAGGVDQQIINQIRDKKDNPMNSVIQINFNEAINPVTVSGMSDDVSQYIRVLNANVGSAGDGTPCVTNSDCLSYSCENNVCQGDYLSGKFLVSNAYRTVEFISDDECGVNGCGEKIYCLPANSHLNVELMAANFNTCETDGDCLSFSPYKNCSFTPLGYKTCQDHNNRNYPAANLNNLDGIIDAAINSLDGNRDVYADGPIDFFSDNYQTEVSKKDKYKFSFYVNDQIALDPPQITAVNPIQGQNEVSLVDPMEISFNSLMMNSSLRTGSTIINNGTSTFEHKLINLRSAATEPLGYWIINENKDVNPLDGVPDLTITQIKHSLFSESVSYKSQVGSGVKDIYQNCFKPSAGPNCLVTDETPSCCFGVETSILGSDGNCE